VKSRINPILLLALNMVEYYNVRMKCISNVATATTIVASEKSKQCQMQDTGKGNIGCSEKENGISTL
jgi:hypothetical protein